MIKRRLCLFFIVALVEIATSMPSFGEWVWNKETGWMKSPSSDVTTIEQRYQYALSLVVEQKYLNAIKEFELIIDADPKSEYAETSRINIGWAYYLNGDCKKALKMYNTVLKKNPGTRRTMPSSTPTGMRTVSVSSRATAAQHGGGRVRRAKIDADDRHHTARIGEFARSSRYRRRPGLP